MIHKKSILFFILSVVITGSAFVYVRHAQSAKTWRGINSAQKLDHKFIRWLNSQPPDNMVSFDSGGGDPDLAEIVAQIILDKKLSITIPNLCASSCAEYFLPAAASVTLSKDSLIGFHQNPLMIDKLKTMRTRSPLPICTYNDNLEYIRNLQAERLGHSDFWKKVLEKLGHTTVKTAIAKDKCVIVGFKFQYPMWFPTSRQLREDFGLKFTGDVCADDKACYSQKLKILYPKGTTLAVGNTTYTVQ